MRMYDVYEKELTKYLVLDSESIEKYKMKKVDISKKLRRQQLNFSWYEKPQ